MKQSYNNHITTNLTNLDWKSFEMPKTSPFTVSALNQIPNIYPSHLRSNSATSLHNSTQIKNNNKATRIIEQRIKPKSNLIFH
jgi:hypothetical protein